MIEKIAKYLILSLLGLAALTFVAVLVLDDELIESAPGGVAEILLDMKHGTIDTVSGKSDTFVYWFRTKIHDIMNFSPTNRTPRVVMRVPPPPEDITRTPGATDEPANTESPPAAMPEKTQTGTGESMPAPASAPVESTMPAAAPQETAPPAAPMPSALGHGTPAMEGAPAAAPVTGVSEQTLPGSATDPAHAAPAATGTEQAALPEAAQSGVPLSGTPQTDAPPPPPAAEEQRPGEADYQQGLKYYNGDGVEQNFGKAAQFFLKAADAGHVGAQYNLGIMNYTGQTGGQDFVNAAKWFEKAAAAGHTQAQYNLGFLYYEGKGVEQDLKTAFDWINRAAEQGYPKAIKARDAFKKAMPEMFTQTQPAAAN